MRQSRIGTKLICLIRPHHMHTIDAAYCYRHSNVICVCVFVDHNHKPRISPRTVGFITTATEICSLGYRLRTSTAIPRSTQPCVSPGSLNRVPASAGVKAGMYCRLAGWQVTLWSHTIWHVSFRSGASLLPTAMPGHFTLLYFSLQKRRNRSRCRFWGDWCTPNEPYHVLDADALWRHLANTTDRSANKPKTPARMPVKCVSRT